MDGEVQNRALGIANRPTSGVWGKSGNDSVVRSRGDRGAKIQVTRLSSELQRNENTTTRRPPVDGTAHSIDMTPTAREDDDQVRHYH
jgi:hypothetical protein